MSIKLFTFLITFHFLEHLYQMVQVYYLGIERSKAGGILGSVYPWLMKSELLHYGYAVFMFMGINYFIRESKGKELRWWKLSFGLQTWHLFEHSILLSQAICGLYPTVSVGQIFLPKIELHFFYNCVVFIPIMVAMYYRTIKPRG